MTTMHTQTERRDDTDLLLGESPSMVKLRAVIRKVAPTSLPVLVHGATGAGKELVARAIHSLSGRSGRLVGFNVCAVADTMFEDALFGHVRGAFTGATSDAPGYLLEADRGTVFMDEIGGLPLGAQAKLLRALETKEFRPVGGRGDRRSDFRVVSATSDDVQALAGEGRFRSDLIHRLSGILIHVPPLRERVCDIPLLARHFAVLCGREETTLSDGAVRVLVAYGWPGNVRELRHVVERAVVSSDGGRVTRQGALDALSSAPPRSVSTNASLEGRVHLMELLDAHAWDTTRVATTLGVHRATIYRQMKRYAIEATGRWGERDTGEYGVPLFAGEDANSHGSRANERE